MNKRILASVLLSALVSMGASAQQSSVAVSSAPPPSAPARRSAAELEKLVAPIALYPDALLAQARKSSAENCRPDLALTSHPAPERPAKRSPGSRPPPQAVKPATRCGT